MKIKRDEKAFEKSLVIRDCLLSAMALIKHLEPVKPSAGKEIKLNINDFGKCAI